MILRHYETHLLRVNIMLYYSCAHRQINFIVLKHTHVIIIYLYVGAFIGNVYTLTLLYIIISLLHKEKGHLIPFLMCVCVRIAYYYT